MNLLLGKKLNSCRHLMKAKANKCGFISSIGSIGLSYLFVLYNPYIPIAFGAPHQRLYMD